MVEYFYCLVLLLARDALGRRLGLLGQEQLATRGARAARGGLLDALGLDLARGARLLGEKALLEATALPLGQPQRAPRLAALEVRQLRRLGVRQLHFLASTGLPYPLGNPRTGLSDARPDKGQSKRIHPETSQVVGLDRDAPVYHGGTVDQ